MITSEEIKAIKDNIWKMLNTGDFDVNYLCFNLDQLCSELEIKDEKIEELHELVNKLINEKNLLEIQM